VLKKRSFSLAGHRTSVALEPRFWDAVSAIAASHRMTLAGLVAWVDATRDPGQSLASSLRILALDEAGKKNPLLH
jgi:predicted DNA-binding ribbon-helix-helix protein